MLSTVAFMNEFIKSSFFKYLLFLVAILSFHAEADNTILLRPYSAQGAFQCGSIGGQLALGVLSKTNSRDNASSLQAPERYAGTAISFGAIGSIDSGIQYLQDLESTSAIFNGYLSHTHFDAFRWPAISSRLYTSRVQSHRNWNATAYGYEFWTSYSLLRIVTISGMYGMQFKKEHFSTADNMIYIATPPDSGSSFTPSKVSGFSLSLTLLQPWVKVHYENSSAGVDNAESFLVSFGT
jgi:hypothetical protein